MDFLAQLAEGIFPPGSEVRNVALLFGYFDESGTDGQHGFTVITGFVGPVSEWSSLVQEWDAQLAQDGIETFHYVECKGRNKQYYGWDWEEDCRPHLAALTGIIESHGVAAVNAGFVGDYRKVLNAAPQAFAARYPSAYSLCFEMIIARIRQACKQWQPGPISLIFSHHQQFSGLALERWNEAKKQNLWPEILHVGYADPALVHQLQTADMLAWETRRYIWKQTPADKIHELPLLSMLVGKEQEFGNQLYEASMDEAAVLKMADAMVGGVGGQ